MEEQSNDDIKESQQFILKENIEIENIEEPLPGKFSINETLQLNMKKESELKEEQAIKIFWSAIKKCKELSKKNEDPYLSCCIINTNGEWYNSINGDCPLATYGMADNEAFTSLSFSNDKTSVNSGKLGTLYSGISPNSETNLNYVYYPGGVPIYKNGVLLGALGVVCEINSLNEELAILAIESSGYESKSMKQKVHTEDFSQNEVIFIYKNSELVKYNEGLLILNRKTKKPICPHRYQTLSQYFHERSISKLDTAVCPLCVKNMLTF